MAAVMGKAVTVHRQVLEAKVTGREITAPGGLGKVQFQLAAG